MAETPTFAAGNARSKLRLYLWPALVAAMIIIASSRERVATTGLVPSEDKFGHFFVYGLLGTLVCRTGSGWKWAAVSLVIVSAFGASDEWHQSFVPGRDSDVRDWVADTAGAALAIALYTGWGWYRRLLEGRLGRRPAQPTPA